LGSYFCADEHANYLFSFLCYILHHCSGGTLFAMLNIRPFYYIFLKPLIKEGMLLDWKKERIIETGDVKSFFESRGK